MSMLINADEARKRTEAGIYNKISQSILSATENGYYGCHIERPISDKYIQELKDLGYIVERLMKPSGLGLTGIHIYWTNDDIKKEIVDDRF